MSDRHAARQDRLRKALRGSNAEALLVTNETNVRYLSGFTGDSSYLLITPDSCQIISDSRFEEQIQEECPGLSALIRTQKMRMVDAVAEAVRKSGKKVIGFESTHVAFSLWETLRDAGGSIEWVPTDGLVEGLRAIKDAGEIGEIRKAVRLAERAFQHVTTGLTPAMTELEVAHALEAAIRRFGGVGVSFPSIVAVGDRGALPHYRPAAKVLAESNQLLIDWGAAGSGGYVSDLTRTFAIGKVSAKFEKIHGVVNRARQAAIEAIRPGIAASEVDGIARRIIEEAGFGPRFGHGLGHGIGLEVHEAIRVNSISTDTLAAGMVITIEPGIYVPGWGGVRIEDDVLVTRDGYDVLSSLPRELERVELA